MKKFAKSVLYILLVLISFSFLYWLGRAGFLFGPDPYTRSQWTQGAQTRQHRETSYPGTVTAELLRIESEEKLTPIPTSRVNANNWLSMLLSSPTCKPPCWENIFPGKTSLNEGIRIVQDIEGLEFNWLSVTPTITFINFARWDFGANSWGQIVSGEYSETIATIELWPDIVEGITLGGFIFAFEDPTSVVRGECRGQFLSPVECSYAVVFQQLGTVAYLDLYEKMDEPIDISSDIQIYCLEFSIPENIIVFGIPYYETDKLDWKGFDDYLYPSKND